MHARRLAPRTRAIVSALAIAVVALVMLLSAKGTHAQGGIFNLCASAPDVGSKFCPVVTATLANTDAGANSNMITTIDIPSGNYNFRALVSFLPPEWGVPADGDIPNGVITGELQAVATLGLANNPCGQTLNVPFTFMDATTDTSTQVSFYNDNNDIDDIGDMFEIVGGLPRGVTEYPEFLARTFNTDPENGTGTPIKPLARQYGQNTRDVPGTDVSLNFVIFSPGTPITDRTPDPAMGFPVVTILQNLGDPGIEPEPGAVTDFCTPLSTTITTFGITQDNPDAGITGGQVYRTNPSDGDFIFTTFAASQWDTNRNGLENSMDPCKHRPFNPADYGWDPRIQFGLPPDPAACGLSEWPGDANFGDVCYQADGLDPNAAPEALGGISFEGCQFIPIRVGAGGGSPQQICETAYVAPAGGGTGDGAGDGTGVGGATIGPTAVEATVSALKTELDETLSIGEAGLGIDPAEGFDTTSTGTSAPLVVVCAEKTQTGLELVSGEEITFKIDSQPGSDASLEDETATTDAEGSAVVTLNVGSTAGDIVVSAIGEGCGDAKTVTVAVVEAGPATGVGSLAPAISSIPAWAAIASGLGGAGLLGLAGSALAAIFRRRRR